MLQYLILAIPISNLVQCYGTVKSYIAVEGLHGGVVNALGEASGTENRSSGCVARKFIRKCSMFLELL